MPIGLLEGSLAIVGLAGGFSLGSRLRSAFYDAGEDDQPAGGASVQRSKAGDASTALSPWAGNAETMTMTVMLVGEPGAGKSLFCERISNPDGLGGRSLPKTMAPQWVRAEVLLPGALGRVSFMFLDTPGSMPELSIPFYRQVNSVVLVFDVGSSQSFAKMKTLWYSAVRLHRDAAGGARTAADSTIVLAHVIDERRERQVTRREAAAWCQQMKLPFFETHPAEKPLPRVLTHLASIGVVVAEPDVDTGVGRDS